jgi:hypothetical protein
LDRSEGSIFGTVRIENLPITRAGMTVLAPGAEKAPSIPWREREGYRHLQLTGSKREIPVHESILLIWEQRGCASDCIV